MSQCGQVKKIATFRAMSKRCKFCTLQGVSTKITPQTHPNTVNIQRHHPNTIQYPKTSPRHNSCTNWSQQKQTAPTDTPKWVPDIPRPSQVLFEDGWKCLLTSADVCWYVLAFFVVWICLGGRWGCIWVMFMDIWGVCMCPEGYISAHPLNGGKFILFWHSPERQDFSPGHTETSKYQNVHIYPEQKWLGFAIF